MKKSRFREQQIAFILKQAEETQRIYRELGLQLRNKTPKRQIKAKLREDRVPATAPNECWSMDFLSDQRIS